MKVPNDKLTLVYKAIERVYGGKARVAEVNSVYKVSFTGGAGMTADDAHKVADAIESVADIVEMMNFHNVKRTFEAWNVDDADCYEQEEMICKYVKENKFADVIDWLDGSI